MMMRVRGQARIGEVDLPSIEELAAGPDGHEQRRAAVFRDADGRRSPGLPHHHHPS
jgi:hypothetical protein